MWEDDQPVSASEATEMRAEVQAYKAALFAAQEEAAAAVAAAAEARATAQALTDAFQAEEKQKAMRKQASLKVLSASGSTAAPLVGWSCGIDARACWEFCDDACQHCSTLLNIVQHCYMVDCMQHSLNVGCAAYHQCTCAGIKCKLAPSPCALGLSVPKPLKQSILCTLLIVQEEFQSGSDGAELGPDIAAFAARIGSQLVEIAALRSALEQANAKRAELAEVGLVYVVLV